MRAAGTSPNLAATRLRREKLDSDAARAALADLNEAAEDAPEHRAFGLKPLAEQRARIDELSAAADISPRQRRRLGRLQRSHSRLRKGLATAPFETALRRGLIDAVEPLDFDDGAGLDRSILAARAAHADIIAAAWGVAANSSYHWSMEGKS